MKTIQLNGESLTPDKIKVGLKVRYIKHPEFGVKEITGFRDWYDEEDSKWVRFWTMNGSSILDETPGIFEIV